jgi:putative hydroxymethylpyrimidine transport system permease protein
MDEFGGVAATEPTADQGSGSPLLTVTTDLRPPRRFALDWARYIPPAVLFVAIIGLWQLVVTLAHIKPYVLPSPVKILVAAFAGDRGSLLTASVPTGTEIIVGFVVAVACGFVAAIGLVHSRVFNRAVYPLIIASQAIPTLAIAPLLIVWFGFGIMPKVIVIALFGFFPVALNTVAGMNSIERDTTYLMRSLGASRLDYFRRVRLPACMPYFFVGMKQAAVYSVVGAVVGEWVGSQSGLGNLMLGASSTLEMTIVFAAIFYLSLMAFIMFLIVVVIERFTLPWYRLSTGASRG